MGRIIAIFFLIVVAVVTYSWLAGGAWTRIVAIVPAFNNPVGTFFEAQKGKTVAYNIQALAPKVPTLDSYTAGESISSAHSDATDSAALERARQFGQPSPSRGLVAFETYYAYGSSAADPRSEYVIIRADSSNTSPVTITGWGVASAVSGQGMRIGGGATVYRMGAVAAQDAIALKPGEEAIINSGISPVGTSFHTNECTGYLAQFQQFVPSLSNACPLPSNELPNTLDNLRAYGAACIDFVTSLPSCTYYLGNFPSTVSDQCRSFITSALTYNGCIDRHQWDSRFSGTTWHIYLGSSVTLWNPAHDVLRLLDASGRTVDVLSY